MGSESAARNIIGQGTKITGDIELKGDFRIDGELIGSIQSEGRIVIGSSGLVEGNIYCQNADISGVLKGNLHAADLSSLKSTAVFTGDLKTGRISIELGAKFSGKCDMTGSSGKPDGKEQA
ncbi:MAG: Integral membrane protein CcmA involved in cell shape determination [Bacteroidetes bacterium]|nr:MAG: Integral membrane protein CcmA involved in cell shape determination [Bacteroidota bacterium]